MDKHIIINRLADICYRPKIEDDDDYAVQLFIEALVVPKDKSSYTLSEMKTYIQEFVKDLELGEEDDGQ